MCHRENKEPGKPAVLIRSKPTGLRIRPDVESAPPPHRVPESKASPQMPEGAEDDVSAQVG